MKLIELIKREATVPLLRLMATAVVSGLTQAAVLAIINAATSESMDREVRIKLVAVFVVVLIVHIVAKKRVMSKSSDMVEGVLSNTRLSIAEKIRKSELQSFEHIGRARIYSIVTKETIRISEAAPTLIIAAQSGIMVFFALIYLAWLSTIVLLVTVLMVIIGGSIHLRWARLRHSDMQKAVDCETDFFDLLIHLLDGFKEVKMSMARSGGLIARMREVAARLRDLKVKHAHIFAVNFIFSQTAFYVLVAVIVFILPPMTTKLDHQVLVKSVAAILFIVGPLSDFIGSIPIFANANIAAENIFKLEEELDKGHEAAASQATGALKPPPSSAGWNRRITSIEKVEFNKVRFHYFDKDGTPTFTLGPINIELNVGETVFIMGGNGSGKSTFLKLLTALYPPMGGSITVDGASLQELDHSEYRNHFSVIFSDYHLFDRLYGIRNVDTHRVRELLQVMELEDKTGWLDDRFTNLDLSSGQRKRVALLVSFLEDCPIYVFDEWAADQDPNFRKYFYEVILRDLKNQGKTIIAVTHDEKYFHVADRVLKMEYGQFVDFDGHDVLPDFKNRRTGGSARVTKTTARRKQADAGKSKTGRSDKSVKSTTSGIKRTKSDTASTKSGLKQSKSNKSKNSSTRSEQKASRSRKPSR